MSIVIKPERIINVMKFYPKEYEMLKEAFNCLMKKELNKTMKLLLLVLMTYVSDNFIDRIRRMISLIDINKSTFEREYIQLFSTVDIPYDLLKFVLLNSINLYDETLNRIVNYHTYANSEMFNKYFASYQTAMKFDEKIANSMGTGAALIFGLLDYKLSRIELVCKLYNKNNEKDVLDFIKIVHDIDHPTVTLTNNISVDLRAMLYQDNVKMTIPQRENLLRTFDMVYEMLRIRIRRN